VPAAKARTTSSVGGQCTNTATRRLKEKNLKWAALESVTTSTHYQGGDSLALQIMKTRTVLGAPPLVTSVCKTRSLAQIQKMEAGVRVAKIRTTARVNKETASTSLVVTSMQSASSNLKLAGTTHTGSVHVTQATKEMASSAWMEMEH